MYLITPLFSPISFLSRSHMPVIPFIGVKMLCAVELMKRLVNWSLVFDFCMRLQFDVSFRTIKICFSSLSLVTLISHDMFWGSSFTYSCKVSFSREFLKVSINSVNYCSVLRLPLTNSLTQVIPAKSREILLQVRSTELGLKS